MIRVCVCIYIYINFCCPLIFFYFLKMMTSAYLSRHLNFISTYDGLFSNFSYYKCLYSNASKHLEMMHIVFGLNSV